LPEISLSVEIADDYDHKHQDLSEADAGRGLNRHVHRLCKAILRKLAADGTVFTPNVFRT